MRNIILTILLTLISFTQNYYDEIPDFFCMPFGKFNTNYTMSIVDTCGLKELAYFRDDEFIGCGDTLMEIAAMNYNEIIDENMLFAKHPGSISRYFSRNSVKIPLVKDGKTGDVQISDINPE